MKKISLIIVVMIVMVSSLACGIAKKDGEGSGSILDVLQSLTTKTEDEQAYEFAEKLVQYFNDKEWNKLGYECLPSKLEEVPDFSVEQGIADLRKNRENIKSRNYRIVDFYHNTEKKIWKAVIGFNYDNQYGGESYMEENQIIFKENDRFVYISEDGFYRYYDLFEIEDRESEMPSEPESN